MRLDQLVQTSRILALRKSCARRFKEAFTDITVQEHIGKLDISDMLARDFVLAPAILIAATRIKTEDRMSNDRDLPVQLTAYIITEDAAIGTPPQRYTRDELGYAIGDAVLALLRSDALSRWGLEDIGFPEAPELTPVFTVKTFEKGAAVYAVSWSQTLFRCHDPFLDMEGEGSFPEILYPGDPDPAAGGS
jgi:hypothetical protein